MEASVNASMVSGPYRVQEGASGPLAIAPCTPAGVIRVAVAHRDPVARAALRAALDDVGCIAVVGEAATGEEAVALATHLRPAVVVIDVRLPGMGCVDATRRARAVSGAAVMLLSGDEPDPRLLAALQAGAGAVMRLDSAPSELVRALTLLGRGQPLRPQRPRRGRHPREEPMQLPKVIEIRRGSAHGRTVRPSAVATASNVRHDGQKRLSFAT
jgi:DNA-binding NarL/FixJ family response regulator